MAYNRYANYAKHILPATPKARAIYGERDDAGKWFRCRFCGWPCNIDTAALGDGTGLIILDAPVFNNEHVGTGDPLDATLCIRTPGDLTAIDSDDTISEYDHTKYTIAASGCPSCGSRNWR
jgi:hypothetical protein